MPTPEEVCQKPEDHSGIIIGVTPGNSDGDIGIKPGWTRPFPARWFYAGVRFDKSVKVDPATFRVKVEPARWQFAEAKSIGKPDWIYDFTVLPDGKMQDGPPGWVTVTVEEGKDVGGKSLVTKPFSFRLYMMEPIKLGETVAPCPVEPLIPPPVGGH